MFPEANDTEQEMRSSEFRLFRDRFQISGFRAFCLALLVVEIAKIGVCLSHLWLQLDDGFILARGGHQISGSLCLLRFCRKLS